MVENNIKKEVEISKDESLHVDRIEQENEVNYKIERMIKKKEANGASC